MLVPLGSLLLDKFDSCRGEAERRSDWEEEDEEEKRGEERVSTYAFLHSVQQIVAVV